MRDAKLQRELRRAAEASARRVAKRPKPLREKGEWVYTLHGEVLHRIGAKKLIMDRRGRWKESFIAGPREPMRLRCGRVLKVYGPGIFSRLVRKRCDRCCDAMGITRGYGCPINDEGARVVKR